MAQTRLVFFCDPAFPETEIMPDLAPSQDELRAFFDSDDPKNPFSHLVGQETAKRKLKRVALDAFTKWDHNCSEYNFLVTGPSSVGKTSLVRKFAQVVRLPLVEISPRAIETMDDLFGMISEVLGTHKPPLPLVPEGRTNTYKLPPCIIFIDEAHALRKNVQNELLKAVEAKDRSFITDAGETVSTENVCWFFATTETGDLFGPLLNRFTEINLKPYTKAEIAKIVALNFPDFDEEMCKLVAFYEHRVPRRALAFATELRQELRHRRGDKLELVAKELAAENDIDEWGMHKKHLQILKLVAQKPVAKERLALNLHVAKEELERLIAPPLLMDTDECPALITVCQKGYAITSAGVQELVKRGIHPKRGAFKPV